MFSSKILYNGKIFDLRKKNEITIRKMPIVENLTLCMTIIEIKPTESLKVKHLVCEIPYTVVIEY